MINEIKKVLLRPFNEKMDEYREYMSMFNSFEQQILLDDSEKIYNNDLKELKKKYKNPKGDLKQEYEKELHKIMVEYKKKLDLFNLNKEKYDEMKKKLATWNVYELKKQMEKINLADSLKDLDLTIEQAKNICSENGIEFRINLDEE
ncbi:MAG: hypothetical protein PHN42_02450 [Bacilli bacterium]|nr:hypothetical protein [Bacilli bacterium]